MPFLYYYMIEIFSYYSSIDEDPWWFLMSMFVAMQVQLDLKGTGNSRAKAPAGRGKGASASAEKKGGQASRGGAKRKR